MDRSTEINELAAALAKARAAFPEFTNDKEVEVKKEGKFLYSFKYCPLPTIIDGVVGPLSDHGLSVVQTIEPGVVETWLLHESGQYVMQTTPLMFDARSPQELGSLVTYAKRYALSAMLMIAADDDDDANRAMGQQAYTRSQRPQPSQPRKAPTKKKASSFSAPTYVMQHRPDGIDSKAVLERAGQEYGVTSLSELSKKQAKALVEILRDEMAAPPALVEILRDEMAAPLASEGAGDMVLEAYESMLSTGKEHGFGKKQILMVAKREYDVAALEDLTPYQMGEIEARMIDASKKEKANA